MFLYFNAFVLQFPVSGRVCAMINEYFAENELFKIDIMTDVIVFYSVQQQLIIGN